MFTVLICQHCGSSDGLTQSGFCPCCLEYCEPQEVVLPHCWHCFSKEGVNEYGVCLSCGKKARRPLSEKMFRRLHNFLCVVCGSEEEQYADGHCESCFGRTPKDWATMK